MHIQMHYDLQVNAREWTREGSRNVFIFYLVRWSIISINNSQSTFSILNYFLMDTDSTQPSEPLQFDQVTETTNRYYCYHWLVVFSSYRFIPSKLPK